MNTSPMNSGARAALPIRTRPFGWMTDLLLPVFERDPTRMRVWLSASRPEWHFAGLVAALLDDPVRFAEIEPMLFVRKKKDVLAEAAQNADPRSVKLTGKLRGDLWRPPTYRRLVALMADPMAARLFTKTRSITRRKVMLLSKVPAPLRCSAVYERLKRSGDAERVVFAITLAERIRPDLSRSAVLRSLGQTSAKVSLEAWARQHFRSASFPAPPWPGTAKLKPLANWDAIQRTAQAFKNCIRDYAQGVLAGSCYLYHYKDEQGVQAVVEFQRLADNVWAIDEINGPDNRPLTAIQEAMVIAEASDVAIKLPANASRYNWADPSY